MKVGIKKFQIDMEVKTSGVEFEVRSVDGSKQLGDLVITKTKLIWCKGKTSRKKGKAIKWEKFIEYMESL